MSYVEQEAATLRLLAELFTLRAENERLKKSDEYWTKENTGALNNINRLEADVAVMREALKILRNYADNSLFSPVELKYFDDLIARVSRPEGRADG